MKILFIGGKIVDLQKRQAICYVFEIRKIPGHSFECSG